MIRFDFDLVNVRIDDRGVYSVFESQRGPVARHIRVLGKQVEILAKSLAGVRTGRLKRSIKMSRDRTTTPGRYAVLVGSDVRHALVHHQGARPHIIKAKRGGTLVFRGSSGMVYTKSVNHPGSDANRYLVNALRAVVRR